MINFKCPSLTAADIHNTVQEILTEHWNKKIPVEIDVILDSLEFEVETVADLNYSGIYSFLDRKNKRIFIDQFLYDNYNKPNFKIQADFALAHELGHYFLHHDLMEEINEMGIPDKNAYLGFLQSITEDEYDKYEFQAKLFARKLLIPGEEFKAEIEKLFKEVLGKNIPVLTDLLKKDPITVFSSASNKLSKTFEVSHTEIEIYLKNDYKIKDFITDLIQKLD